MIFHSAISPFSMNNLFRWEDVRIPPSRSNLEFLNGDIFASERFYVIRGIFSRSSMADIPGPESQGFPFCNPFDLSPMLKGSRRKEGRKAETIASDG